MPRNASGDFTLPTNDSSPAEPRNVIRSSDFNELMSDISSALTDSLSRSGDGVMLSDLDMDGNDILNAPLIDAGLALAATALQPAAIGTTVQAYSANLDEVAAVNPGTAGLAILADGTEQDVRDYLSLKYPLVADTTGATNAAAALTAAVAASNHVRIPPGTYLIDTNVTIPAGVTVEFDQGAVFNIGTGITVTWNGGIKAGPYQQIFSGDIVQSAYTRIGDIPYTFALQGSPQIEWSSPFWFGAAGDGVTDDIEPLYCAQYFGDNMYVPGSTYILGNMLQLRVNGQRAFGDGYNSILKADGSNDNGATIGFRGQPPTTAAGAPAKFMVGGIIEGLHIDGADAVNQNGAGGNFCRDCKVFNNFFSNIGRKAITWQYHVQGCIDYDNTIYDAVQEVGNTTSAISIEGQGAGLNYTNDGGVASTDDLFGADCFGNVSGPNIIYESGYSYVTFQRCMDCVVNVPYMGAVTGNGTHIIFADYSINNEVVGKKAGNTARRFVLFNATSSGNVVRGIKFGDNISSAADGYSIHDLGTFNRVEDCSLDHSNTNNSTGRGIELAGSDFAFNGLVVRSCDESTVMGGSGHRIRVKGGKITTGGNIRLGIFGGDDVLIEGVDGDPGTSTGWQMQGARPKVINSIIRGDGNNRVFVDGTTAAPSAYIVGNHLPGTAPQINFSGNTLFSSVCENNPGNVNTGDNALMGPNARWQDATGDLRVMTTGAIRTSDTDGVVAGTQT